MAVTHTHTAVYRSPVLKGYERSSSILLTQARYELRNLTSRVERRSRGPCEIDVELRVDARDLRSRIDPGLEIEDINQRSAVCCARGWPFTDANRKWLFLRGLHIYPYCTGG